MYHEWLLRSFRKGDSLSDIFIITLVLQFITPSMTIVQSASVVLVSVVLWVGWNSNVKNAVARGELSGGVIARFIVFMTKGRFSLYELPIWVIPVALFLNRADVDAILFGAGCGIALNMALEGLARWLLGRAGLYMMID